MYWQWHDILYFVRRLVCFGLRRLESSGSAVSRSYPVGRVHPMDSHMCPALLGPWTSVAFATSGLGSRPGVARRRPAAREHNLNYCPSVSTSSSSALRLCSSHDPSASWCRIEHVFFPSLFFLVLSWVLYLYFVRLYSNFSLNSHSNVKPWWGVITKSHS